MGTQAIPTQDEGLLSEIANYSNLYRNDLEKRVSRYGASITNFSVTKGDIKGSFSIVVSLVSVRGLKNRISFYFNKPSILSSLSLNKFLILESKGGRYRVCYTSRFNEVDMLNFLRKYVIKSVSGIRSELFLKTFLESVSRDGRMVRYVRLSTNEEDLVGVDVVVSCFVKERGLVEIPIQVKTNSFDQIKHKTRYPGIPSIVVRGVRREKLKDNLYHLFTKYLERKIVHL